MTEHIHLAKTRPQIINGKIAQTQWEDLFNDETHSPNEGGSIRHVHSLGVHPCLLIPELNKS